MDSVARMTASRFMLRILLEPVCLPSGRRGALQPPIAGPVNVESQNEKEPISASEQALMQELMPAERWTHQNIKPWPWTRRSSFSTPLTRSG